LDSPQWWAVYPALKTCVDENKNQPTASVDPDKKADGSQTIRLLFYLLP